MYQPAAIEEAPASIDEGCRALPLTPAVRNDLQICLSSIELLGLLEQSAKAYACLFRLQRAIDRILGAAGAVSAARDSNEAEGSRQPQRS
jgi:hypothetical protein